MVKDAELISDLSRATAMIYPSRLEPFGLAPLEANACGTPVIGLAEGGVRETVVHGENGLLVPNARPETIAAAIQKIINDPELAAQLRRQCRPAVLARWKTSAAVERLETALLDTLASVAANRPK
jgi:glycosyltransferase involved in cell wall biosynthesis